MAHKRSVRQDDGFGRAGGAGRVHDVEGLVVDLIESLEEGHRRDGFRRWGRWEGGDRGHCEHGHGLGGEDPVDDGEHGCGEQEGSAAGVSQQREAVFGRGRGVECLELRDQVSSVLPALSPSLHPKTTFFSRTGITNRVPRLHRPEHQHRIPHVLRPHVRQHPPPVLTPPPFQLLHDPPRASVDRLAKSPWEKSR